MARSALAVRQKLSAGDSLDVADSLRNLCIILGDEAKWEESENTARRVLNMRRKPRQVSVVIFPCGFVA